MNLRIVFGIFLPAFVLLIICTSVILDKSPSHVLLLVSGIWFIVSFFSENRLPRYVHYFILMLSLGVFHWISHLNWCNTLYLMVSFKPIYRAGGIGKPLIISLFIILQYTIIRLSYVEFTSYNILVSFYDTLASILVVFVIRYLMQAAKEKQSLIAEKDHLFSHDPLTDLFNNPEYNNQIDRLIMNNRTFVHLLIDCENFKEMNHVQGVPESNDMLKNIADFLQVSFADAIILSRYGGDEFAAALEVNPDTMSHISESLDVLLPQLLNLKVTFSYAIYPDEAASKQELFSLADNKLFQIRRENWLNREEHLFRSEKLRAIGELAAGMAHEIRNPLTTIKGFLQIAKANGYNIKPWSEIIDGEITRMTELTAEFLQFSKPHISNLKAEIVQECILRVMHLTESQALLLGHQVMFTNEHPAPLYIQMDKDKIVQVLINIVKNGLEAMNENGTIDIRLRINGEDAIVEVADTGKGIPATELEKIFYPFYTTKQSGTGLGLSICHKIIQDHHGKMEVHSVLNQGTTFRITLPINRDT